MKKQITKTPVWFERLVTPEMPTVPEDMGNICHLMPVYLQISDDLHLVGHLRMACNVSPGQKVSMPTCGDCKLSGPSGPNGTCEYCGASLTNGAPVTNTARGNGAVTLRVRECYDSEGSFPAFVVKEDSFLRAVESLPNFQKDTATSL